MNSEYYILNPTGNITALVVSETPVADYKKVNDYILKNNCDVEQVGFVDFSDSFPKLCMAGGEFCGNATLSTAALFCMLNNIDNGEIFVNVSGADKPISVLVNKDNDRYLCKIKLPKPNSVKMQKFSVFNKEYILPLISFNGISHILVDYDFDKRVAEELLKIYSEKLNISAMGAMMYDEKNSELLPLVYVRECDTLFYENSCASGSCAVCGYLTEKYGDTTVSLKQPGGVLTVSLNSLSENVVLSGFSKIENHIIVDI